MKHNKTNNQKTIEEQTQVMTKVLLSERSKIDRTIYKIFLEIKKEIELAINQHGLKEDLGEIYLVTKSEYIEISVAMKKYGRNALREDFTSAISELKEKYKKKRDGVSIEVTYC